MQSAVIGLGETGGSLYEVLGESSGVYGYDIAHGNPLAQMQECTVLNVCFGYGPDFIEQVKYYQSHFKPKLTVIHSTVPVGTTSQIKGAVHSPILGDHTNMKNSIKNFVKWVGGDRAPEAVRYFEKAGLRCKSVRTSEQTELFKLMCLAKYGMSIAFAQYQKDICDEYAIDYKEVLEWDVNYNEHVPIHKRRPVLIPPEGHIGGHCVIPGTQMLQDRYPNPILNEVLKYGKRHDRFVAWKPCNIYSTAKIGDNVSIGMFSEIGNNVVIGDRARIGMGCFIPEGVTIEEDVFIGPRVVFSNDRYPPSGKGEWERTLVKKNARIGAGACILPGVTIGEYALIGMGAVVTQDVADQQIVKGVPAK